MILFFNAHWERKFKFRNQTGCYTGCFIFLKKIPLTYKPVSWNGKISICVYLLDAHLPASLWKPLQQKHNEAHVKCRYCCAGLTCLCLSRAEKKHWTYWASLHIFSSLLGISQDKIRNKKYIIHTENIFSMEMSKSLALERLKCT